MWVGAPLWCVTPEGEGMSGHEGGAGRGLKILGWTN